MGIKKRHEAHPRGRSCCGGGSPEDCQEITDRRTRCISCDTKARRSELNADLFCLDCAAMVRCEGRPLGPDGPRCKRFRPPEKLTYGHCEICLATVLGLIEADTCVSWLEIPESSDE